MKKTNLVLSLILCALLALSFTKSYSIKSDTKLNLEMAHPIFQDCEECKSYWTSENNYMVHVEATWVFKKKWKSFLAGGGSSLPASTKQLIKDNYWIISYVEAKANLIKENCACACDPNCGSSIPPGN